MELDHWIDSSGLELDPPAYHVALADTDRLRSFDLRTEDARIVMLGETNHFVREKTPFRLWWLERLARKRPLIIGEELGWSDGRRVAAYLSNGQVDELDRVATFGYKGDRRTDRDDSPTGIFRDSFATYPHALMKAEHSRFYRELRSLKPAGFFGFDIDSPPGGAYDDLLARRDELESLGMPGQFWEDLARVDGESMAEETIRLERLHQRYSNATGFGLIGEDLRSLIESLEYTALFNPAPDYEATRAAMAFREQTMKRRLDDVLANASRDALVVLMGHAFHLAKDDRLMQEKGVGPGGGRVSSLGHYLTRELNLDVVSVWMIYGGGRDSQPLVDLPQTADYPDDTVNAKLSSRGRTVVLPLTSDCPFDAPVGLGHLYNLVAQVDLCAQTDAIMFFPKVSPLGGG